MSAFLNNYGSVLLNELNYNSNYVCKSKDNIAQLLAVKFGCDKISILKLVSFMHKVGLFELANAGEACVGSELYSFKSGSVELMVYDMSQFKKC